MTNDVVGSVDLHMSASIATITLNRPGKLNALTPEMLEQALDLLGEVRHSSARAVVVRGAGERAFCVGADINRFADLTSVQMLDWTSRGHRVFDALAALPQPTIAVLHGPVFGGGLELALACDLRIAISDATFGLPEVGLGTVPGWGGTERLAELVGRSRTKEVILARRRLDASTALDWGVINQLVDRELLEDAVDELASRICSAGPVAVRIAKMLIDSAADGAPARILEQLGGAVTSATQDLTAGIAAFRSRTNPTFTGN